MTTTHHAPVARSSDQVLNQLRQSGAILHVFSVANSSLRATVTAEAWSTGTRPISRTK